MKFLGLILGALGVLAGAAIFLISLMLPALTNNRVNIKEAFPGIVLGAALFLIFFLGTLLSLILVLIKTNNAAKRSNKLQ